MHTHAVSLIKVPVLQDHLVVQTPNIRKPCQVHCSLKCWCHAVDENMVVAVMSFLNMHREGAGNVQGHRCVACGVSKKTMLLGHGGSQVVRKGHALSSGKEMQGPS